MAGNSLAQEAAILITTRVADEKATNDAGGVPLPDSARAFYPIRRAPVGKPGFDDTHIGGRATKARPPHFV